ncbi:MAG: MotA/TolQ/ExbB proton channel family protein [Desulfobulbus sp.]|nr:MAG: MotA/TolQ/ExbB proton channel family protein [Desulfobulbus sp.]
MSGKHYPVEFLYQIFSLLIAFILVHGAYITVIRPQADQFLTREKAQIAANPQYEQQRNFYVVLRDYEQEACFVLMLWAMAILGYKGISIYRQQRLLGRDLLGLPPGLPVGIEDTADLAGRLEQLPLKTKNALLPRAMLTAIQRFAATRNVQDAATSLRDVCESEGDRLESELSTIRYIAWAIPSVGFIGTVRGIGAALGQANKAVEGDITGVTQSLGVAFNSTFIALVISIVLMFFIHQLQLMQERLVLDSESYGDRHLVSRMRVLPPV